MFANIDFIVYYLLSNTFIYFMYPTINFFMSKLSDSYNKIKPKHKQVYFVSNILKGGVLGIFSYNAYNILKNYYNYSLWNKYDIKLLGAMYASLDMISTINVHKMQLNTIIHHIVVQILYLSALIFLDFGEDTVSKGIVIYAIFSTFAFIVNIYLALRLIYFDKYYLKILASISSFIYQVCCALNWGYQVYFYIPLTYIILLKYYIQLY